MPQVSQLNSLKTLTEFATSQGLCQCGLAALPASSGNSYCNLLALLLDITYNYAYKSYIFPLLH